MRFNRTLTSASAICFGILGYSSPALSWEICPNDSSLEYLLRRKNDIYSDYLYYFILPGPKTENEVYNRKATVEQFSKIAMRTDYAAKCISREPGNAHHQAYDCVDGDNKPLTVDGSNLPNFRDKNGTPGKFQADLMYPALVLDICSATNQRAAFNGGRLFFVRPVGSRIYTGKMLYMMHQDPILVRKKPSFVGF